VPAGSLTANRFTSEIFSGSVRDYWAYVPAQYRKDSPAAVMVFQDGGGFVKEDGRWHVPIVFDNLIHKGEMPVTIGIFVDPGVVMSPGGDHPIRWNQSFEYDALGDRYARFLLDELLPEVNSWVPKLLSSTTPPQWVLIIEGRFSRGPMPSFQWYSSAKQPPGQRRTGTWSSLRAATTSLRIPRVLGRGPTQMPS
jgi:hypothetical protein